MTTIRNLALGLLLTLPMQAGWLTTHRAIVALEAVACADSVADIITTYEATSIGARESNPLFIQTGTNGRPNWTKIILFKSAVCGLPFAVNWAAHRYVANPGVADGLSLGLAAPAAGVFTYAVWRNLGVIQAQRRINAALAAGK